MKKTIMALILACAGCCTIPLIFPAIAGVSVFGISLFRSGISLDAVLCALPVAALAAIGLYLLIRVMQKKKVANTGAACKSDASCGCK